MSLRLAGGNGRNASSAAYRARMHQTLDADGILANDRFEEATAAVRPAPDEFEAGAILPRWPSLEHVVDPVGVAQVVCLYLSLARVALASHQANWHRGSVAFQKGALMLPAPSLTDVRQVLDFKKTPIVALLFAPPYTPVASERVVPRLGYLDARTGQSVHFFCAGYGGYWWPTLHGCLPTRSLRWRGPRFARDHAPEASRWAAFAKSRHREHHAP